MIGLTVFNYILNMYKFPEETFSNETNNIIFLTFETIYLMVYWQKEVDENLENKITLSQIYFNSFKLSYF